MSPHLISENAFTVVAPHAHDERVLLLWASLVIAGLLVVSALVIIPTLPGPNKTSSTSHTSTSSTNIDISAANMVSSSFADHMRFFAARNTSAIPNEYEDNANVTWTGSPRRSYVGEVRGLGTPAQIN